MKTESIIHNATAFVLDDPMVGGQALVVVSPRGCIFLVAPGVAVKASSLSEMRAYFGRPDVALAAPEASSAILAEIARLEVQ